mmetsp:Transcript_25602/g.46300  ORF Transcript_25602/g.46300 Transcript_25602/m.46300 type:complete len:208 (-) Transcript_25602:512-1135(-)
MPRQGLYLVGMVGERRGRTYVIPSSHMRYVPEFDGPVGGTARQHLLMNRIPTQSHNCIGMTPLPQSRFGWTTLLFLLLVILLPTTSTSDGGARWHRLRLHPIRLGAPRIHPTQYQRRLQCIHHVQIPNLNSRFERPNRDEISGSHILVVIGFVRADDAPQRQAERVRRKRNVVMHVQIGRLGVEHVDFEGGKVLLRLGHHHERIPIV